MYSQPLGNGRLPMFHKKSTGMMHDSTLKSLTVSCYPTIVDISADEDSYQ